MVHGRLDIGGPLVTAWEMKQAWPRGELVVIDEPGHGTDRLLEELVRATNGYRGR